MPKIYNHMQQRSRWSGNGSRENHNRDGSSTGFKHFYPSNRRGTPTGNSRFGGVRRGNKPRFAGESFSDSQFIRKAEEFVKIEERETINNFSDFGLRSELLSNIVSKGYVKPTPIQDEAIPAVISGRDVLGIADTGTGKTAAFVIPLLNKILLNPNERIMIMAPTRELAMQIKQEIRSFTPGLKVYIALAIGGAYMREQIIDIKRGPHIIVGTPGRIKDLGARRVINFTSLDTLVLDEVDRMLDMGFIDDIRSIVDQIPKERQTLFFSATVNHKIELLINTFLRDPVKIALKSRDASTHVEQNVVRVKRHEKEDVLCSLLKKEEFRKVLVFGGTRVIVDRITNTLTKAGLAADAIHGDKRQYERQKVLRAFRENQISILVATDVAARGLDIADITHVINFDKPNNYDDYIHRIGRTGRGDAKGYALTFVER